MAASKSELDDLHRLLTRAFTQGIENDLEDGVFNPPSSRVLVVGIEYQVV